MLVVGRCGQAWFGWSFEVRSADMHARLGRRDQQQRLEREIRTCDFHRRVLEEEEATSEQRKKEEEEAGPHPAAQLGQHKKKRRN